MVEHPELFGQRGEVEPHLAGVENRLQRQHERHDDGDREREEVVPVHAEDPLSLASYYRHGITSLLHARGKQHIMSEHSLTRVFSMPRLTQAKTKVERAAVELFAAK